MTKTFKPSKEDKCLMMGSGGTDIPVNELSFSQHEIQIKANTPMTAMSTEEPIDLGVKNTRQT